MSGDCPAWCECHIPRVNPYTVLDHLSIVAGWYRQALSDLAVELPRLDGDRQAMAQLVGILRDTTHDMADIGAAIRVEPT